MEKEFNPFEHKVDPNKPEAWLSYEDLYALSMHAHREAARQSVWEVAWSACRQSVGDYEYPR